MSGGGKWVFDPVAMQEAVLLFRSIDTELKALSKAIGSNPPQLGDDVDDDYAWMTQGVKAGLESPGTDILIKSLTSTLAELWREQQEPDWRGFADFVEWIPYAGTVSGVAQLVYDASKGKWVAVADDAVGAIPGGKWGKAAGRGVRVVRAAVKAEHGVKAARKAKLAWKIGDSIWKTTRAGKAPSWSTVRRRYWINAAAKRKAAKQYSEKDLERMRKGLAPRRENPDAPGGNESLELSHEPKPAREGGRKLKERWPCEHADVDRYRNPGYCKE